MDNSILLNGFLQLSAILRLLLLLGRLVVKYFLNVPNEEQLSLIFNNVEKPLIVYLYDSWNIRKKIINK